MIWVADKLTLSLLYLLHFFSYFHSLTVLVLGKNHLETLHCIMNVNFWTYEQCEHVIIYIWCPFFFTCKTTCSFTCQILWFYEVVTLNVWPVWTPYHIHVEISWLCDSSLWMICLILLLSYHICIYQNWTFEQFEPIRTFSIFDILQYFLIRATTKFTRVLLLYLLKLFMDMNYWARLFSYVYFFLYNQFFLNEYV